MLPLAIAAGASGLLKLGTRLLQSASAKKWLKNNPEVVESMSPELKRNQQLASINANVGTPREQYNNAMKNIQNQQLMALRTAALQGGGKALGIIGATEEYGNRAKGAVDAQSAENRLRNQNTLMNVNAQVAREQARLFDANVRQPDLRKRYQQYNQLAAGQQNIAGGLDSLASGAITAGMGGNGSGGSKATASSGSVPTSSYYTNWLSRQPLSTRQRIAGLSQIKSKIQ